MKDTTAEDFYQKQQAHHHESFGSQERRDHVLTWLEDDTVDAWRHQRIRNVLVPLITYNKKARWLTVGDGRYATDAQFILKHGGTVVASDISELLLKEAKKLKRIPSYRVENAEKLSFKDNSFDYVYCKEAYHHFPRPAVAVYEMMRVAKKGIILQEPKDEFFYETWRHAFWHQLRLLKMKVKGSVSEPRFEPAGNYLYGLHPNEIKKMGLGLGWRGFAYTVTQDSYIQGVEYQKAAADSDLFRELSAKIESLEKLYRQGREHGGIVTVMLFKQIIPKQLRKKLESQGFTCQQLAKNPYI